MARASTRAVAPTKGGSTSCLDKCCPFFLGATSSWIRFSSVGGKTWSACFVLTPWHPLRGHRQSCGHAHYHKLRIDNIFYIVNKRFFVHQQEQFDQAKRHLPRTTLLTTSPPPPSMMPTFIVLSFSYFQPWQIRQFIFTGFTRRSLDLILFTSSPLPTPRAYSHGKQR